MQLNKIQIQNEYVYLTNLISKIAVKVDKSYAYK